MKKMSTLTRIGEHSRPLSKNSVSELWEKRRVKVPEKVREKEARVKARVKVKVRVKANESLPQVSFNDFTHEISSLSLPVINEW